MNCWNPRFGIRECALIGRCSIKRDAGASRACAPVLTKSSLTPVTFSAEACFALEKATRGARTSERIGGLSETWPANSTACWDWRPGSFWSTYRPLPSLERDGRPRRTVLNNTTAQRYSAASELTCERVQQEHAKRAFLEALDRFKDSISPQVARVRAITYML